MDFKVIFDNCALLFEYFGWYSILLVVGTFGLMIPLNLLYKKIMKKESLDRLRKVISSVSVYAVALGLIALFTGVVIKAPLTASYLLGATLPCGILAQILWAVVKVVRDYGVQPLLKAVAESKEFSNWLKSIGLDKNLVDNIMTGATNYLSSVNATTVEDVIKQELALTKDLRVKLSGFVDTANMDTTVAKLIEQIKSKYPTAKETTTTTK